MPPSWFELTQRFCLIKVNEKQECKCKKLPTAHCERVLSFKSISNGFLFSGVNTCNTGLFEKVRVIHLSGKPGIIVRTIRTVNDNLCKGLNSSEEQKKKNPDGKKKKCHRGGIISQELHVSLTVWTFAPLSQFDQLNQSLSSTCVTYNHIMVATAAHADAAASSF